MAAPGARAVPLHVEEVGRGPPVVMLHGWSLSSRAMGALAEALAPRFRVLLADLRGHGRSPAPPEGYGVEDHAADLAALLDRLRPERPALVGWSLGASAILAALPSLAGAVAGAALIAPTPRFCAGPDWTLGLPAEAVAGVAAAIRGRPLPALRRWFTGMFAEGEIEEPPLVALAQHMLDGAPPDPEAAARSLEGLAAADLRGRLPSGGCPLLLLHGDRDPIVPPGAAAWLADRIAGARLFPLPGAGHAPQLSQPRAVADALSPFLGALPDAGSRA